MKILVTGGLGFIGHHLVNAIAPCHEVTIIDSLQTYGTLNKAYMGELYSLRERHIRRPYIFLYDDVRSIQLKNQFDVLVFLSGYPRQYETSLHPQEACDILGSGLTNILSSQTHLKQCVFISTSMVYGDFDKNVKEETLAHPVSQYATMRLVGEYFVKGYCKEHGIASTIIRPSAVYGPYDTYNRIVGKFFIRAMNKKPLEVKGCNEVLDFTYVTDLARGIALTLANKKAYHETFNLTRSFQRCYTIEALAQSINLLTGNKKIRYMDRDAKFPKRSILSIEKARKTLGYRPRINLDAGLLRTYTWLKNHPELLRNDYLF